MPGLYGATVGIGRMKALSSSFQLDLIELFTHLNRCGGASPLCSFVPRMSSKFAQQLQAPRHAHLVHLSVHFCVRWSLEAFTFFSPFPLPRVGPAKISEPTSESTSWSAKCIRPGGGLSLFHSA